MRYLLANDATARIAQLEGETYVCAMLQWRAGLRIAEALAVKRSDVDLDAATLTVQSGKGGKRRTVPLHEDLAVIFKTTLRPANNGPYVRADPSTIFRRYARVGIPGTHTLRHSAARHWLNEGVPINQVSLLLGHSSLETTVRTYLPLMNPAPGALAGVR